MKRHLCILLVIAMLAPCSAFAEPLPETRRLQPGDGLYGFTVAEVYDSTVLAMRQDLYGIDAERTLAITKQIRDAKLEDQAAAAEHIAAVLSDADLCMVGNEALIRADADCFEEIVSWRGGSGEQ